MTPKQRNALHDVLDHAINTGASISLKVHPDYQEDLDPIRLALLKAGFVTRASQQWVNFGLPDGIPGAEPVTLFDAQRGFDVERPARPAGTNPTNSTRRFDVV